MNKNIENLWNSAAELSASFAAGNNSWETQKLFIETFAKLVATECADISDSCFHNGSAGYTAILNHFGVKDDHL